MPLPRYAERLKQITYGANDGIVTTFAVVAGFAGAEASGVGGIGAIAVLVFGLANLFADATSMGLGEWLSARAARDVVARRRRALDADPSAQHDALTHHFQSLGLTTLDAATMAALAAKSPALLTDLTIGQIEGLEDPGRGALWARAVITFVAFVAFGIIPLLPYVLGLPTSHQTEAAIVATFAALALLGILRHHATRAGLVRCVGETVALGGICAAVAYGVGSLVAG